MRDLPVVDHCTKSGVFGETRSLLSYPSKRSPFLYCCEGAIQLASGSFSERIVLYVAVDWLCLWEEVSSGFFYAAILKSL